MCHAHSIAEEASKAKHVSPPLHQRTCQMQVDVSAFATDLESFMTGLQDISPTVDLSSSDDGAGRAATISAAVDESQVNRLVLDMVRIGESHGIRFPRCTTARSVPNVAMLFKP
jgi:hypothetical protein